MNKRKTKKESSFQEIAKITGVSRSRAIESVIKAQLITAIIKEVQIQKLTHEDLSLRSGLPRSAVTGIISGSLQKVTIDRILRLIEAVGLRPHLKLTKVA